MTSERLDEIETWIHEHCVDKFPYDAIIELVAEVRNQSADLLSDEEWVEGLDILWPSKEES